MEYPISLMPDLQPKPISALPAPTAPSVPLSPLQQFPQNDIEMLNKKMTGLNSCQNKRDSVFEWEKEECI